ncbi:MAG: DNA-directed RNA polymerase subunit omega [Clostridia bacterium]|nr:DNA-directed RNA polymerase subunit omega [Clostridia bacterium]
MMIEPPIDELVKRVSGNKYLLACLITKRAKYLALTIPDEIEANSNEKEISIAAREVFNGEVIAKKA